MPKKPTRRRELPALKIPRTEREADDAISTYAAVGEKLACAIGKLRADSSDDADDLEEKIADAFGDLLSHLQKHAELYGYDPT